jgi:hypothetical protein
MALSRDKIGIESYLVFFANVHWYLSQLILSAHCEMIPWEKGSNETQNPTANEICKYLHLEDVSGETIL